MPSICKYAHSMYHQFSLYIESQLNTDLSSCRSDQLSDQRDKSNRSRDRERDDRDRSNRAKSAPPSSRRDDGYSRREY